MRTETKYVILHNVGHNAEPAWHFPDRTIVVYPTHEEASYERLKDFAETLIFQLKEYKAGDRSLEAVEEEITEWVEICEVHYDEQGSQIKIVTESGHTFTPKKIPNYGEAVIHG